MLPRLVRAIAPVAVLLGAALGASVAHAASFALQGTAMVSGAYNDNVNSAPEVPTATSPAPKSSDFFGDLRVGLILTTGSARAVQRLAYTFSGTLYVSTIRTYSNRLDWAGAFVPSRNTQLLAGLAISQGLVWTHALALDPSLNGIQPQQNATQNPAQNTIMGLASESLIWDVNPRWRLTEGGTFTAYLPYDPPQARSYLLDAGLQLDRVFRTDAVGIEGRVTYGAYGQLNPDGTVGSSVQQQLINKLVLKWKHDFGHYWNLELNGGVVEVKKADDASPGLWNYAALAAIAYARPEGSVALVAQHGVVPAIYLGQSFEVYNVALRGALPLGQRSHVTASAAVAYQNGKLVDIPLNVTDARLDVILVDAALTWAPIEQLMVFARYQFTDQIANPTDRLPQPNFRRNLALVGLQGTYPGGARVPRIQRSAPTRVDGSDQPGIPAPHSDPAPKGS